LRLIFLYISGGENVIRKFSYMKLVMQPKGPFPLPGFGSLHARADA